VSEPEISPERMAGYRAGAARRQREREQAVTIRHERAWRLAREAARLLKTEFGATRVVAFGSLVVVDRFHEHSDVDLATWGVSDEAYYGAVGRLLGLDPEFPVDLIGAESASPGLLETIQREGVEL
jgi:uncharacterized protein